MRIILLLPFLFLWLSCTSDSFAQRYFGIAKEEFGKNKTQAREIQWKTFSSANFEFNFYRGGEQISKNAAIFLEQEHSKLTGVLGYLPYEKTKIFIFNSPQDLDATNLIDGNTRTVNNSLIDIKGSRILTAYNKNDSLFHQEIITSVASIYVYNTLFGGNIRESLESQFLLNLPEWFTSGLTAFVTENHNDKLYDKFKATILQSQSQRLKNLKGSDATLVGQSIWNFIAIKYGKDNIANILNLTRIIYDEQSSITSTLGISFTKFMKEWTDYYLVSPQISETKKELVQVPVSTPRITNLLPGEIDTDNYFFSPNNIIRYKQQTISAKNSKVPEAHTTSTGISQDDNKHTNIKAFKNFLIAEDRKINIIMDPVRQFGLGYSLSFYDLLKNNIFKVSSYLKPSAPLFKDYDFDLSYGNYAHKTDFILSYTKRSINLESIDSRDAFLFRPLNHVVSLDQPEFLYRRLISQTISATANYPFSNTVRVEVTPRLQINQDLDYSLNVPKGIPSDYYFAPNLSVVFDNSKESNYGVVNGTKAKLSYDQYIHLKNGLRSFKNTYVDIRHYQKITKGLQIVGRLSYGTSRGNAPKFTFIGGVENSINRKTYYSDKLIQGGDSDLKNILLYNFPGNLRGFDFGRLFGNNHLLTNIELRSPLAEFLPQMALSSNLLRNLQIIGFYDLGTAWIGSKGPFSRQNSLNTSTSGQNGPFIIEVTNFKKPFISGYGGGIRTTILGIFIRADYAIGIEDGDKNPAKFHLSVGKDF